MYHFEESIRLKHLNLLMGDLFKKAEDETKKRIQLLCPEADEEWISIKLFEELAINLYDASLRKDFEFAFEKDINETLGYSDYHIQSISKGLVANISKHKRCVETKSGGDFGLLINFPKLYYENKEFDLVQCGDKRGILVQAKLKKYENKWGELTPTQLKIFEKNMSCCSLLRYSYLDAGNRRLDDFQISLCEGYKLTDLKKWLKNDQFLNSYRLYETIMKLGDKEIGTEDDKIIETIICPDNTQTIIITVDWEDRDPRYPVEMFNQSSRSTQEKNCIYVNTNLKMTGGRG